MVHHTPRAHAGTSGPDAQPSRVLRWAVASALLGAMLIYNSAAHKGTALPVPPPPAAVPAPVVPPGGDLVNTPAAAPAPAPPLASGPAGPVAPALPASKPTRLTIPSIGVNAPFTPLHLDSSGRLGVPPENDTNLVGWYAEGHTPGERGNAIVAGHVDTTTGPAVFLFLSLLKPGSTADITRADGTVATFRVDSVRTYRKDAFPDQLVYGDTKDAELRLITCGGTYDRSKRDYRSNVVVFAHLESSRRA
jgi:hypothetical protein